MAGYRPAAYDFWWPATIALANGLYYGPAHFEDSFETAIRQHFQQVACPTGKK
jgi:hypothetical protein